MKKAAQPDSWAALLMSQREGLALPLRVDHSAMRMPALTLLFSTPDPCSVLIPPYR